MKFLLRRKCDRRVLRRRIQKSGFSARNNLTRLHDLIARLDDGSADLVRACNKQGIVVIDSATPSTDEEFDIGKTGV